MNYEDRRKHIRVNCLIQALLKYASGDSSAVAMASVVDISEGGVRLKFQEPLVHSDNVTLSLKVSQRETIETEIEPLWSRIDPTSGQYHVGARFVDIQPRDQGLIEKFVTEKLNSF